MALTPLAQIVKVRFVPVDIARYPQAKSPSVGNLFP
jgi:hypothetical protein